MEYRVCYKVFRAKPTVRLALGRIFLRIGFHSEESAREHVEETIQMVEELFPEARGTIALYDESTLEHVAGWKFGA